MTDFVDVRADSASQAGPADGHYNQLGEPTRSAADPLDECLTDSKAGTVMPALIQSAPTTLNNRRSLFRR